MDLEKSFEHLNDIVSSEGHPSWKIWQISDHPTSTQYEISTYLLQELYARGIFTIGSHIINYCHTTVDLAVVANAYVDVLDSLSFHLSKGDGLKNVLNTSPLKPLFSVR